MDDNRNHMRYTVRDNVFVAVGGTCSKVGSLKDISLGGLSFEYMDFDCAENMPSDNVSLLHTPSGFSMPDIPCRIVYDMPFRSSDSQGIFLPACLNKRCGLEFVDFETRHRNVLGQFLEQYRAAYRY